jgi:ribosome modulation factor
MKDRYDAAYERGYADGVAGRPKSPPTDDSKINYLDGYEDGRFKREEA